MSSRKKRSGEEPSSARRKPRAASNEAVTPDKPPRVTVLAAQAVAQTAREQQLTAEEEEQLKTRLQYRLYQRNHRAKKQRRTQELEEQVSAIREELVELQRRRDGSQCHSACHAVSALAAAVSSSKHSLSPSSTQMPNQMQDRLSSLIEDNSSLRKALRQWTGLCEEFQSYHLTIEDFFDLVDPQEDGDVAIVSCGLRLTLTGSMDHYTRILPALHATPFHRLALRLSKQRQFTVPGRGVFVVSARGRIHEISMDFDFVKTLASMLGEPLTVVAGVLIDNRLNDFNLLTYNEPVEIVEEQPTEQDTSSGQRLSMEFLLG